MDRLLTVNWQKSVNFYGKVIAILLLLNTQTIYGQYLEESSAELNLKNVNYASAATTTKQYTEDEGFGGVGGFTDASVATYVQVYFDQAMNTYIPTDLVVNVGLEIKRYPSVGAPITETDTLRVSYSSDNMETYQDKAIKIWTDPVYYKIRAEIKFIKKDDGTNITPSTLPINLKMFVGIRCERYYDFDKTDQPLATKIEYLDEIDAYSISGFDVPGALSYDVEWTYVDDYDNGGLSFALTPEETFFSFKNNATRINVAPGSKVILPAIFDRGYLIVRARGIGPAPSDVTKLLLGAWSLEDAYDEGLGLFTKKTVDEIADADYYIHIEESVVATDPTPHIPDMGWMVQTTFAEEGKMKHIVQYFDATGRVRQTATMANTEREALVTETIYDYQGRAVFQSLPAPAPLVTTPAEGYKSKLKYYSGINQTTTADIYDKSAFTFNPELCMTTVPELGTGSGAGNYYSPDNGKKNNYHGFIPDANGYPFTFTGYKADNTSRVYKQSGVGETHRMGGGHEVVTYYGTPDQVELDRLFGANVGLASHYFKTAIVDPNGQVSVSYTDIDGHVIATALAGIGADNVEPLMDGEATAAEASEEEVTVDVLNISLDEPNGEFNDLFTEGTSTGFLVKDVFIVPEETPYNFVYTAEGVSYMGDCLTTHCFECVYDIEITLTDGCGNQYLNTVDGNPFTIRIGEMPLLGAEPDTICDTPYYASNIADGEIFDVILPQGEYTLLKTITLNEEAMHIHALNYIQQLEADNPTCYETLTEVFDDANGLTFDCELDCSYCEEIESFNNFLATKFESEEDYPDDTDPEYEFYLGVYNDLKEECALICETNPFDPCEAGLMGMLADMSPGGQYGEYINSATGLPDAAEYYLSVYNEDNFLQERNVLTGDAVASTYKNPKFYDLATSTWIDGYYIDGVRTVIDLSYYEDMGILWSDVADSYTLDDLDGDGLNEKVCYPEQLKLSYFVSVYNYEWGYSLICYHPEYYYYQNCVLNRECTVTIENPETSTTAAINTFAFEEILYTIDILDVEALPTEEEELWKQAQLLDPLFADGECGSGLTNIEYFEENYLLNFQHCESGEIIDIYEAVYNSVNGIPGFGEPCEALEQLAGADLEDHFYVINSDLAWALYVNFYRSAKQKYLNAVAHYYAQGDVSDEDGEPDRFGINLSIGNDEFVAPLVYTYLSLDVDEYWYKLATNENYLPVIVRSILLQDKLVRFPDVSWHSGVPPTAAIDGPEITELVELGTASTDAAYYSLTGNKPLAFDMETFLQGVLNHAEIKVTDWRTADYPIEDIAGISERLYDALTERCLNEFDVTISTSVITNDLLTWTQETGCTPTEICTDNFLLLAATSAYDWTDDVVAFHNLIITDAATGEFTIEVFFNDAGDIDTVLASGVTCIPVNQNTFNLTSCDLTPTGNGAWGLLNYILLEPGIDINNTTGEVVDEALIDAATKAYLGDAPYYWKQIDYAIYELYNDANTHAIRFMIENTSGISTPFINDDDNDEIILSFEANPELGLDGYPVTEGYDQYFAFTQTDPDGTDADYHGVAYYRNIPGDEADFILYNYPMALCGQMYPFTQPCIEPEQLSAAHLSELFAELLGGTETFTVAEKIYLETPDAYPGWSPHLSAMMGATFGDDDEEFMYIQDYSSYAMTIVFKTETTIGDITLCTVTLEIPGDDAALTLEDISENIVLIAHEELGVGGTTHEFTLECNDDVLCGEDDLAITVWGHIDCIGLKNCPCENNLVDDYFFNSQTVDAQIGNGGGIGEIEEGEIETTPGTSTNCDLDVIYTPMLPDIDPCLADQMAVALNNAYAAYNNQVATYINNFEAGYTAHCLENLRETLVKSYAITEYHYTLYYYDQAGNLTMTVPPAGVDVLTGSSLDSMANYRKKLALAEPAKPQHNLATSYWYNSLSQLCKQKTPDAGISKFWYDYLGRIVLSQNAEQANIVEDEWKFSYTLYDGLGRIYEVGEITLDYDAGWVADVAEALESESNLFAFVSAAERAQVTSTYYDTEFDLAGDPFGAEGQKNLRNRIGAVTIEVDFDNIAATYDHATHYSYDIHGNLFTLVQENPAMGEIQAEEQFKRIDYTYDLISGNVHEVAFQHDKADQFYQHYDYDADNRIYEVQTSRDGWIWEKEARYFYYRHGPLARTEIGDLIVQGNDYAYTIKGWLKGVNAGALIADRDMGKDGYDDASNSHKYIAQDAFGFILDYFESDYSRINSGAVYKFIPNYTATNYNGVANSLYNGNIMSMSTALLQPLTETDADGHHDKANVLGKIYAYDQLNRIASSNSYEKAMTSTSNFTWADTDGPLEPTYASQNWNTTYTYDGNGNILSMQRAGNQNTAYDMDQLTYHYIDNTNQLLYVDDAITDDGAYDVDVDDQEIYNYTYDRIGNLTADVAEGIEKITWNVYGKIKKIVKENESGLVFEYDAIGNRISKTVIPVTGDVTTTYYVRDAMGNVMAVYTHTASDTATFVITEQHIYGSSRIGMVQTNIDMLVTFTEDNYFYRILGEKRYELSNHLGNVLSVISDRRLAFDSDANGTTNYYEADVMSSMDYDPYGMLLTGRNWEEVSEPRYGFNGKESDTETYGIGNIYDYGFRIYNPRLGKFLSIDPLYKFYSQLTPYQFASNTPICAVDIDGQESKIVIREVEKNADGTYKIVSVRTIIQNQTATETRVWAGDPIQIDGTTVLAPGQEFQAATTYTYDMIGEEVVGESVLYELVASWMPTPSAAYDYSHGTIPGKQADDLDYLTQTPVDQGLNVLARRDAAAPDNAIVAEDVKAGLFVFTLMIGYNGAQFPSKTLWREKEGVARIDVENPAPGVRSGQIHFQDNNNNKYMWNFNDKKFYGYNASTKQYDVYDKALNEKLMGNDEVVNAIKKSYKFLGEKYE